MLKQFAAPTAMLAVAWTLQNLALAVAGVAFLVAVSALVLVNRRLDAFADTIHDQSRRLSVLEEQTPGLTPER